MILAIDVGNTHITFGCLNDENQAEPVLRIPTDLRETEFGYAVKMHEILDLSGVDRSQFQGAIVSSVVPQITEMMKRAVKLICGFDPLIVGPGLKSGIKIELDDPGTLAADLIATAVAARTSVLTSAVVVVPVSVYCYFSLFHSFTFSPFHLYLKYSFSCSAYDASSSGFAFPKRRHTC